MWTPSVQLPAPSAYWPQAVLHRLRISGSDAAIEVDGYEKRAARQSLDYDNDRANALTLAGWTLLRFGWTKVRHQPEEVARAILVRLGQLGYPLRW